VRKKAGGKKRDLVLSTKIFWGGDGVNDKGLSHKHIIEGTNSALKRLQTEYVDLIFCHRPDIHTPVEETVRAMNILIQQGKAFYWGTSEWSSAQIIEAHLAAQKENLIPPLMEQTQYNLFVRDKIENDYLPLYKKYGLGLTTFSPLASGILTGKYINGFPNDSRLKLKDYSWLKERFVKEGLKEKTEKVSLLKNIADEIGIKLSQLSIAWCLLNDNVSTVITGASKIEQIEENIKALNVIKSLNNEIINKIEDIIQTKPVPELDFRI
jgi:voltage-dependent potassium channel beta subunit